MVDEFTYEKDLEDGLHIFLDGPFSRDPTSPFRGRDQDKVIANTARGGVQSGQWTQPDLILIALQKLDFLERVELEIFSFELKREDNGKLDGVFEAVAHTRFAHYAYLAWHLPVDHKIRPERLRSVESNCQIHGIGLVTFSEPRVTATYRMRISPIRKHPHPYDVDEFLSLRLKPDDREALKNKLRVMKAKMS